MNQLRRTIFPAACLCAPLQANASNHSRYVFSVDGNTLLDRGQIAHALAGVPALPQLPAIRDKPEVVQVCVAASAMKINPGLLDACREIAERCSVPVHFHFTVAFAHGVLHEQVSRVVRRRLGMRATVHSHRDRPRYMDILRACDLFIDPFPFGNTNGLIDCIEAGLIGICMVGPEVHQRIDQALMQRLSMPAWLAAPDRSCYVEAAVRLIEQHELRGELRRRHSGAHALRPLFHGRPHVMARRFLLALDAVQAGLEHGVARHRRP